MRECRRYLVKGRVQGVFYRASTRQAGEQLGLTGWVRNLGNGDVEAVACGEADKLKLFEKWLWQGPAQARVDSVQVEPMEDGRFNDFSIR